MITITVTLNSRTFTTQFPDNNYPDYALADEAYKLAMLFAETQAIAIYGHSLSGYDFSKFLENLDYKYERSAS